MKKILVIEDQEDIREIVRATLELAGFDIEEADEGEAGLAIAARWRPDLVLTDVRMPGSLNGFQVCERIKRSSDLKRVRVVILTALNQVQDRQIGLKSGADDFLVKPFSPVELTRTVDRVLR